MDFLDKKQSKHRAQVSANILTSDKKGEGLVKAIYQDNPENRKLGRVGKEYDQNKVAKTKEKVRELASKKDFGEALNLLASHSKEALLLQAKYNVAKKKYQMDLISYSELSEILDEVSNFVLKSVEPKKREKALGALSIKPEKYVGKIFENPKTGKRYKVERYGKDKLFHTTKNDGQGVKFTTEELLSMKKVKVW